ncbi:hypothetical protein K458DRAFT_431240 [Lentithecium fluviatile CBS 122367]|uniref:FAD-binding FR-type domain-containing protein n=1 Tax=Lentithecium fluviatile CBS 122367 TaxID=1168545 RepID=A0A6G1J434_9PLEO|nr:hypothetical protein K458DRAFT_431240 [Lentithecium fluviatile CBS 122367]
MANNDALDDVRYEHHLKHRGRDNQHIAQLFWLLVCSSIAVFAARRGLAWWERRCNPKKTAHPHRELFPIQIVRIKALLAAISLLSFRNASVGRIIILSAYTIAITTLLVSVNAPAFSTHFLDDVAFRAAWVTVAQVPLVYLLSTKRGPLNSLTGISHDRINWLHRWTGRILFLCATTHMAIMMSSISIAELMRSPDGAMSVVRYGAGAYGTLTLIAVSSILPLRRWSYRAFHINHWICTLLFLGIVVNHVPSYARLPIYVSFALVATDKCLCAFKFLSNNINVRPLKRMSLRARSANRQVLAMGHPVKMMTPFITNSSLTSGEPTTIIRISDVPLQWKPGQHVRLYLPKLGVLEMHPFTPATCSDVSTSPFPPIKDDDAEHYGLLPHNTSASANEMVLMIKAHSGFTRRLSDYYSHWLALPCPNASQPSTSLTAYIDGPYGNPPSWAEYGNIVLIATSTGVTFLLSILDYLEQLCFEGETRLRTQQIKFIWANRHIEPQFEASVSDLLARHTTMLRESDIKVEVEFYTTCEAAEDHITTEPSQPDPFAHLRRPRPNYFARRPPLRIRNPNALDDDEEDDGWYHGEEQEHSLKQIHPYVSEMDSRSSCETYVSSTLIDDESESDESDYESMMDELDTSCWSRMPSLRLPRFSYQDLGFAKSCQCTRIRHEQRKIRQRPPLGYISRFYGSRPDVTSIISTSIPRTEAGKTMVAVCSNAGVVTDAQREVSKMNVDFARGRRESGVDIYTEGFR